MEKIEKEIFKYLSKSKPSALAEISGGQKYPDISGVVEFYSIGRGCVVVADIEDLPKTDTNIFAFHIHEGDSCENDFALTGGHYNTQNQPHPKHAGDMPPLFAFDGEAFLMFYTQRFSVNEIIGKTVVIHDKTDDFVSQPSGNSGEKIACGVVKKVK